MNTFSRILLGFACSLLVFTPQSFAQDSTQEVDYESLPYVLLQRQVQEQAEIDAQLLAELHSGNYTLENPLVIVDPYGESPLTALALFTTQTPTQVLIHVHADAMIDDASFIFEGHNTEHMIPIYGLYANRINNVTLRGIDENGNEITTELEIETDLLPAYLDDVVIKTHHFANAPTSYYSGFNFPSHHLTFTAFDSHGDWRFAFADKNFSFSTFFPRDTEHGFFSMLGERNYGDAFIFEVNPLGKILALYHTPAGLHHDLYLTEHNTLLLSASNDPATTSDLVNELDLNTGEIIQEIDYRAMLDSGRKYGLAFTHFDWLRNNSIVEDNQKLIMSGTHQSLIMSNNWDGSINWMLSDPFGYSPMYEEYLLTPIGDDFEYPYNQHAVEAMPDMDNNPATVDILMFDNGLNRVAVDDDLQFAIATQAVQEPYLYSRMVQFRINEEDMTVEQIWQYGQDRPELFTDWRGNADYLPNGNRFGTFELIDNVYEAGRLTYDGDRAIGQVANDREALAFVLVEVAENGDEVWEAMINSKSNTGIASYKTERLSIYTHNANDLRIGDEVPIFFPEEFLLQE